MKYHFCKYKSYFKYIKSSGGRLIPSYGRTTWPDGTVTNVIWMFSMGDLRCDAKTPEEAIKRHISSSKYLKRKEII